MKSKTFKLTRTCSDHYRALVAQALADHDILVDEENCALISPHSGDTTDSYQWVRLGPSVAKPSALDKQRVIQCLPCSSIEPGVILVKEDVYFNICNSLELTVALAQGFCNVNCEQVPRDYLPRLAVSVKVSPIRSAYDLASDDDGTVLSTYFQRPRYVHVNDVLSVPLSISRALRKSALYHDITDIHFKVIAVEVPEEKKETGVSDAQGVYVLKQHSDLYCLPAVSSYLPPKALQSNIPPDLHNYVEKLTTLFAPFVKTPKPDLLPFFLLSGSQGSGKMSSLKLTTELMGLHLLAVHSYEFFGVSMAAVEAKLDYLLQKSSKMGPCVLAVTGFELVGKDKNGNEDARLVSSFLERVSSALAKASTFPFIIIGLTDCKTEDILPSVARAVVQSLKFHVPAAEETLAAIVWLAGKRGFELSEGSLRPLSNKLSGYVHSDLALLVNHGIRIMHEEEGCGSQLQLEHLERGLELMERAYSDAIGAAKVPSVRWNDVGGLSELKEEVMLTLNLPLRRPGMLSGGLRRSGILFYGPPGTGKTLMAKAVATECSMNFLSVKGPELMNMYVGQSERNVREVFERGREAAPCILFFDELDSLAPNRGKSGDSGGVTDRVVSQLLAEMDGLQSNKGLFVIAATNRPDLVDPALLRPGRFDKMFYLGPCVDAESKLSVLRALTNKFVLSSDVDLDRAATLLPSHVTGADVYSVCSNAWLSAARRNIANSQKGSDMKLPLEVSMADIECGVQEMVLSLTPEDLQYYEALSGSADKK